MADPKDPKVTAPESKQDSTLEAKAEAAKARIKATPHVESIEEEKPNLTRMGIEGQLYGQLVNQGKSLEEAARIAKERAAAMCK